MQRDGRMIAHIGEEGRVQTVREHLLGTAERAEAFAGAFGCGRAGYLCGLLHDIGKYSDAFQSRIRNPLPSNRVDHSTAGALEVQKLKKEYIPLGMAIAGHHSGLPDGGNPAVCAAGTYFGRLRTKIPDYSAWEKEALYRTDGEDETVLPSFCAKSNFSMSFFIRMLYSCLVDADYLDTETFMRGGEADRGGYATPETLLERFAQYVAPWLEEKEEGADGNAALCRCRTEILKECMEKGGQYSKGLYTLTVPTGGGKTTASMGFALEHANRHSLKRIIYVIPYTSVIDQNAAVFEQILGQENVVEHHSGILYDIEEGAGKEEQNRRALATENWDAPVIVTTAVQFFESLYANRSSKCRKLHNLAGSVIIFDEAQTLPVPYLEPCVAAISELVKNYGTTVVLCTATQPALEPYFQKYLPGLPIREICRRAEGRFSLFERTSLENLGQISMEELEGRLRGQEQVLCIVNRRKTAQELYRKLEGEGVYCLTTLLCPADRKAKFAEIKGRLQNGKCCRVIATSLIEAGVDLDFPQVYRQEAGLDSLIQAAGRCNREGRRPAEESRVYSFYPEGEENRFLAQNIAALRETWRKYEKVNTPEAIAFYFRFFRDLLGAENLDQKGIMSAWQKGLKGSLFPFASVAQEFRLIENIMKTVYIPKAGAEELLKQVAEERAGRNTFRRLGQYGVNVHEGHFKELWESGCMEEIGKEVYVLRDTNQYDENTGLQMDVETGFGILI